MYQHEAELGVLDRCSYIVEVGALTVGSDEKGTVVVQNVSRPHQFTQQAVDEILTMKFYNGNYEQVVPQVYHRSDWYTQKFEELAKSIDLISGNCQSFNE